jgi:hypothetical protein
VLLSLALWLVVIGIFLTAFLLLAYFAGKPETVYLQIDDQGRIFRTKARVG